MATKKATPAHLDLERSVARVVLQATTDLAQLTGNAVRRRPLINYLRGNRLPAAAPGTKLKELPATFGLFWALGPAWAEELLDRLLEEGYLSADSGPGGGITLTSSGERLLATRIELVRQILPRRGRLGAHPRLENKLRELRRRLAQETGRPPYGIYTNATLAHLAAQPPRDLGELAAIPGFGEKRLRKFGRRILAVLRRP